MTTGFSDPITAGPGQLVQPSIHSPNFSEAAKTGWSIDKNGDAFFYGIVTSGEFTGTDFIINSSGAFFYSSAPAAGNLIASVASVAGTDQFGNAYKAGMTTYGTGGDYVSISENQVSVGSSSSDTHPCFISGGGGAFLLDSGLAITLDTALGIQLLSAVDSFGNVPQAVIAPGPGNPNPQTSATLEVQGTVRFVGPDGNAYHGAYLLLEASGQTVSAVTDVPVTGWGGIPLAAGTYHIRGRVQVTPQQAAGGVLIEFTASGGLAVSSLSIDFIEFALPSGGGLASFGNANRIVALSSRFTGSTFGAANREVQFDGTVIVSTAGTITPQVACQTAGTDTWQVKAGSYIEILPVTA